MRSVAIQSWLASRGYPGSWYLRRRLQLYIRQLPINGWLPQLREGLIDGGEWPAAKEAFRGGERRRVRGFDDDMPLTIYQSELLLRRRTPQHEDNRRWF